MKIKTIKVRKFKYMFKTVYDVLLQVPDDDSITPETFDQSIHPHSVSSEELEKLERSLRNTDDI